MRYELQNKHTAILMYQLVTCDKIVVCIQQSYTIAVLYQGQQLLTNDFIVLHLRKTPYFKNKNNTFWLTAILEGVTKQFNVSD